MNIIMLTSIFSYLSEDFTMARLCSQITRRERTVRSNSETYADYVTAIWTEMLYRANGNYVIYKRESMATWVPGVIKNVDIAKSNFRSLKEIAELFSTLYHTLVSKAKKYNREHGFKSRDFRD